MTSTAMASTFVRERNEALFSLDEQKIRAFNRKYNVRLSDNPLVFWASIYKTILAINSSPADVRKKAENWLDSHGFHHEIGPIDDDTDERRERYARHTFEHVVFPSEFYRWGDVMINQVSDGGSHYLAEAYKGVECQGNALQPFKPKHFKVLRRDYPSVNGTTAVIRMELPKPTSITECRRIYLCRNSSTGNLLYLTSELSMQGTYYLCAWTKKHTHMLLSMEPVENEFDAVAEMFNKYAGFEPAMNAAV